MTDRGDRRFGTRLPVRLSVDAQIGLTQRSFYTYDVGLEGIFLTTGKPLTPFHLVLVTVKLPGEDEKVRLRGVVVRTVTAVEAAVRGLPPGMGVHVYGSGQSTRWKWFRFIEQSKSELSRTYSTYTPVPMQVEGAPDHADNSTSSSGDEDSRSVFGPLTPPPGHVWTPLPGGLLTPLPEHVPIPRAVVPPIQTGLTLEVQKLFQSALDHSSLPPCLFRIAPATTSDLRRFFDEALSQDGIVLVDLPPDTDNPVAVVAVVHPITGAEFHVPGKVVRGRVFMTSTVIRFLGITQRTLKGFEHFMSSGAPPPFDDDSTSISEEMVIYEDAHETQGNMGKDPPRFSEVSAFCSTRTTSTRD